LVWVHLNAETSVPSLAQIGSALWTSKFEMATSLVWIPRCFTINFDGDDLRPKPLFGRLVQANIRGPWFDQLS
jgi:hypothetical protein